MFESFEPGKTEKAKCPKKKKRRRIPPSLRPCHKRLVKTTLETGVKSDVAFCLGPSIEKTNSGIREKWLYLPQEEPTLSEEMKFTGRHFGGHFCHAHCEISYSDAA